MKAQPKMITRVTATEFETDDGVIHEEILSISDAASILGVSDETLRNWEREGKLTPFHTEGGHRRYYRADIENLFSRKINDCSSDCRTEEGITIGLIDSIIFICRILAKRNFESFNVKEALKDLKSDEDVKVVLNG